MRPEVEELKKTYNRIIRDKNSTGRGNSYWRFFDDFHKIYFNDPKFNPSFTMSSTGNITERENKEENPCYPEDEEENPPKSLN